MLRGGRNVYAVFMAHLAVEKALKGLFQAKLSEGVEDFNTDYFIDVYIDGKRVLRHDVKIGPLMTDLAFNPDVVQGNSFDPYSDAVDVKWDWHWPWNPDEEGYGLRISYWLKDDASELKFEVDDSRGGGGDMGGKHQLALDATYLKKSSWTHGFWKVKWEGFKGPLAEEGHRIKGYPDEGETGTTPFAPAHVAKEGKYRFDAEMKLKADELQRQVEVLPIVKTKMGRH